jgi:hypothetical protein
MPLRIPDHARSRRQDPDHRHSACSGGCPSRPCRLSLWHSQQARRTSWAPQGSPAYPDHENPGGIQPVVHRRIELPFSLSAQRYQRIDPAPPPGGNKARCLERQKHQHGDDGIVIQAPAQIVGQTANAFERCCRGWSDIKVTNWFMALNASFTIGLLPEPSTLRLVCHSLYHHAFER